MNVKNKFFVTRELHPEGFRKRTRTFYTGASWDKLVQDIKAKVGIDDFLVARVISIHGQPQAEVGDVFFIHKHQRKNGKRVARRRFFDSDELEYAQGRADWLAEENNACFIVAQVLEEVQRVKDTKRAQARQRQEGGRQPRRLSQT